MQTDITELRGTHLGISGSARLLDDLSPHKAKDEEYFRPRPRALNHKIQGDNALVNGIWLPIPRAVSADCPQNSRMEL